MSAWFQSNEPKQPSPPGVESKAMSKRSKALLVAFLAVMLVFGSLFRPRNFRTTLSQANIQLESSKERPQAYHLDIANRGRLLLLLDRERFTREPVFSGDQAIDIIFKRPYPFLYFWQRDQFVILSGPHSQEVEFQPKLYPW